MSSIWFRLKIYMWSQVVFRPSKGVMLQFYPLYHPFSHMLTYSSYISSIIVYMFHYTILRVSDSDSNSFMLTLCSFCYLVLYLDSWLLQQALLRLLLYLTLAMYNYQALGLIFYTNTKLLCLKPLTTNPHTLVNPLILRPIAWLPLNPYNLARHQGSAL